MPNLIALLPDATTILYNAVTPGTDTSGTKLDIALLEFNNGNPAESPDVIPTEIYNYLSTLATDPNHDYLRCNILAHNVKTDTDGNPFLNIIINSDGEIGIHGKPFSAAANSHIHSIIIAASRPDKSDLLFARIKYPTENQIPKPENGSITAIINLNLKQLNQ
jgi:hypothetical protein